VKEKITIKCINGYMFTGYNITKHQNINLKTEHITDCKFLS